MEKKYCKLRKKVQELSRNREEQGGRKKKLLLGRPTKSSYCTPNTITSSDIIQLSPSKPIPPEVEKAMAHVMRIKIKQSTLINCAVQFRSGAGQSPLTVTPIRLAKKDSGQFSARTVLNRIVESKNIMKLIANPT